METEGEDAAAEPGRDVELPFPVGGDVGGGCEGGGDPCHPPSEHPRAIYCDKAYYVPVSGGRMVPRILGIKSVVVTGGTRYIVDTGRCLGSGGGN